MTTRVSTLNLIKIEDVIWHKPLFNLFGTIEVKGTTTNIRLDQNHKEARMIVPNLSMFCYKFFFLF